MLGTYEFSDYPMDSKTYGIKTGEHIPGEVVHRYLTNFAEHFEIYRRIRFNARVDSAGHREGEGWIVTTFQAQTSADEKDRSERAQARALKLIVGTGRPIPPSLEMGWLICISLVLTIWRRRQWCCLMGRGCSLIH